MDPHTVATLVDSGTPFLGGLLVTLLAYRVVGKPPGQDPRWDAWHAKWGVYWKVLGPLLMGFGVLIAVQKLAAP
jgi:hypothetical protein